MADDIAVCPECHQRIRVKGRIAGRQVRCPGCDHHFGFEPIDDDLRPEPQTSRRSNKKSKGDQGATGLRRLLRMPMSLFVANLLVLIMIGIRIADAFVDRENGREAMLFRLVMSGIGVTVCAGLLSGYRLGWLWARLVSATSIVFLVLHPQFWLALRAVGHHEGHQEHERFRKPNA